MLITFVMVVLAGAAKPNVPIPADFGLEPAEVDVETEMASKVRRAKEELQSRSPDLDLATRLVRHLFERPDRELNKLISPQILANAWQVRGLIYAMGPSPGGWADAKESFAQACNITTVQFIGTDVPEWSTPSSLPFRLWAEACGNEQQNGGAPPLARLPSFEIGANDRVYVDGHPHNAGRSVRVGPRLMQITDPDGRLTESRWRIAGSHPSGVGSSISSSISACTRPCRSTRVASGAAIAVGSGLLIFGGLAHHRERRLNTANGVSGASIAATRLRLNALHTRNATVSSGLALLATGGAGFAISGAL